MGIKNYNSFCLVERKVEILLKYILVKVLIVSVFFLGIRGFNVEWSLFREFVLVRLLILMN